MAFIDSTYLNNQFGSSQVSALCPTNDELNQTISSAEAMVEAALVLGGYSRRESTSTVNNTPEIVKLAAYGQWLQLAHLRMGLTLNERALTFVNLLGAIRDGSIEIDGESKSTSRAVGGVSFTESDEDVATSSPQVFSRSKMVGF